MKDESKTKKQLIEELTELRKQKTDYPGPLTDKDRLVLNAAGEGIIVLDTEGKHSFVNPSAARMLGYPVSELVGKHSHSLWHNKKSDGSDYPEEECPIYAAYNDGKVHSGDEEVFWRKDGTYFPVFFTSTPLVEVGVTIGAVITFNDITHRKRIEKSLKLDEERLEALLKLSRLDFRSEKEITDFALEEGVRLTKSKGGYLHFFNENEQTIHLYSWSKSVLSSCTAEPMQHYPLEAAGIWADSVRFRKVVIHNDYQALVNKKGYPEGHFHLIRHLGVPIFDGSRIVGVTGVGNKEEPYDTSDARQITLFMNSMWRILRQKRLEQEREKLVITLRELSLKDELTGLYNRRGFFSTMTRQCAIASRVSQNAMLIFFDLDDLKQINDRHGHTEGDQALISAANILKNTFRNTDIIGRIGGDEFAVFGMVKEDKDIDSITSRINEKVKQVIGEHNLRSQKPYMISLSYGIALADTRKPFSCDAIMSEADKKMYRQKKDKKLI
jgi:diguanylate cyclase (GGDEF)-like protein/PAS domain S-box-containing protein